VRCLTELNGASGPVSQSHFSERLGQLVDWPGSITLSKMLGDLPGAAFTMTTVSTEAIEEVVLREHLSLVRHIAVGFVPGGGPLGDDLPTAAKMHSHCRFTGVYGATRSASPTNHAAVFEPYRKFYVAHQGHLAVKIQHLRSHVEDAISGLAPELAQLASLNKGLGDALCLRSRQLFDVVPALLGRYFGRKLDKHWQELPSRPAAGDWARWMNSGGWLSTFCGRMQALLFDELDLRLQPVLGMIDSISEAVGGGRTPHEGKH